MEAFRNSTPGLKGRALPGPDDYEQIPALAERGRTRVRRFFETLNSRLGESPFVAGPRYSLADITAQVTIEFAKRAKLTPPESCTHLISWFTTISTRPSAKA
jgi:glutathione S-transferase